MKLDRRTSWAVVVALASALAGCADEDRPPASESAPVSTIALGGSGSSTSDTSASSPDGETTTPHSEPGPCEPRSYRECKIYFRDETGQLQCPTNAQFCDDEGATWLPCGEYSLDENGELHRIH